MVQRIVGLSGYRALRNNSVKLDLFLITLSPFLLSKRAAHQDSHITFLEDRSTPQDMAPCGEQGEMVLLVSSGPDKYAGRDPQRIPKLTSRFDLTGTEPR
jgi:hypothetical protein